VPPPILYISILHYKSKEKDKMQIWKSKWIFFEKYLEKTFNMAS